MKTQYGYTLSEEDYWELQKILQEHRTKRDTWKRVDLNSSEEEQ